MNSSKILHIETENPPLKCTQDEILQNVSRKKHISVEALTYYKRFLRDKGIQTRTLGLSDLDLVDHEGPDEANRRFQRVATGLGTRAAEKCLAAAGLEARDIDGLIIATCTGYLCPGLTSYISQAAGLRNNIFTLDLVGSGCAAAIPALRAADQFLKVHPHSNLLVVCAEVCSAALSWGDETDLILSNAIFGDGAAACLLSNRPRTEGFEIRDFESLLWPEFRDDLRFKKKEARLCNVINKNVPKIVARAMKNLWQNLKLHFAEPLHYYAVHPGGRRILDEIENSLGLKDGQLNRSREILRDYGNMSSPSVLYVLKRIWDLDPVKTGDNVGLFSFGAGFSAYAALLKFAP